MWLCNAQPSSLRSVARDRGRLDRIDDRVIAGTAAVIAGEMLADRVAARHAAACKQFLRGEQHAGRAEPALQRVAAAEIVLQVCDLAGVGDAFDRLDPRAVALHGEGETAAHHRAVDAHRAGAAEAVLAADMTARQAERLAQEIDQRRARVDRLADSVAVHGEVDVVDRVGVAHGRGSESCLATRRSSTPARCSFTSALACRSADGARSVASAMTASSIAPDASAASAFFARTGVVATPK